MTRSYLKGNKSVLLRMLVAPKGGKTAGTAFAVLYRSGGEGVSQITLFNNEKIPSIRTSHNISHKMTFGLPRPSAVSEE